MYECRGSLGTLFCLSEEITFLLLNQLYLLFLCYFLLNCAIDCFFYFRLRQVEKLTACSKFLVVITFSTDSRACIFDISPWGVFLHLSLEFSLVRQHQTHHHQQQEDCFDQFSIKIISSHHGHRRKRTHSVVKMFVIWNPVIR